jgi:hypothetical protein
VVRHVANIRFQAAEKLAVVEGEGDIVGSGSGNGGGVGELQGSGARLSFVQAMPCVWGCRERKLDVAEADAVQDRWDRRDMNGRSLLSHSGWISIEGPSEVSELKLWTGGPF